MATDQEWLDSLNTGSAPKSDDEWLAEQNAAAPRLKEVPTESSSFGRGWSRGVEQLKASGYGALGLVGSATGIEPLKKYGFEGYLEKTKEAEKYPKEVGFFDIKSPGTAFTWAKETLGEIAPSMVEGAITAGVGAAIGSVAAPGPGTATGGLTGFFGKRAVTKLMDETAKHFIAQSVARGMAKETAESLAIPFATQYVEKIGLSAIQKQAMRNLGAKAGIVAGTAPIEAGGNWGENIEQGIDNPWSALATGTAAGFLELAGGNIRIIDKVFGKKVAGEVAGAIAKKEPGIVARFFLEAFKQAPAEFSQEAGQEILSLANVAVNDPKFEIFTQENLKRIAESGMSGALAGAAGGVSGVFGKKQTPVETALQTDPAENQINEMMSSPEMAEEMKFIAPPPVPPEMLGEVLYKDLPQMLEVEKPAPAEAAPVVAETVASAEPEVETIIPEFKAPVQEDIPLAPVEKAAEVAETPPPLPVAETSPETKVETPIAPVVQPGATAGGKGNLSDIKPFAFNDSMKWENKATRTEFELNAPNIASNPTPYWEAGIRHKGWAQEAKQFTTKEEAIKWLDEYDTGKIDKKAWGPGAQFIDEMFGEGSYEKVQEKITPDNEAIVKAAISDAKKNGPSPEFRALFGGIDPKIAGTTPEAVSLLAKELGLRFESPSPLPEAGANVPQEAPGVTATRTKNAEVKARKQTQPSEENLQINSMTDGRVMLQDYKGNTLGTFDTPELASKEATNMGYKVRDNVTSVVPAPKLNKQERIKTGRAAVIPVTKAAETTVTTPKEQKAYVLDKVDGLIADARARWREENKNPNPTEAQKKVLSQFTDKDLDEDILKGRFVSEMPPVGAETVTIDVPNDGQFKIPNTLRGLLTFQRNMKRMSTATTPSKGTIPGAQSGLPSNKPTGKTAAQFEAEYETEQKAEADRITWARESAKSSYLYLKDEAIPADIIDEKKWSDLEDEVDSGKRTLKSLAQEFRGKAPSSKELYARRQETRNKLIDHEKSLKTAEETIRRDYPSLAKEMFSGTGLTPPEGTVGQGEVSKKNMTPTEGMFQEGEKEGERIRTVPEDRNIAPGSYGLPGEDTSGNVGDRLQRGRGVDGEVQGVPRGMVRAEGGETKAGIISAIKSAFGIIDSTITQQWKNKMEEFENGQRRTLQENRDAGIADVLHNSRTNEILRERRLRDERVIDAKVQRELAGRDRDRWEGVGYSSGLAGEVGFLAAREHFASLGYNTVPITAVKWNGCVDFGTKTVFIGEAKGNQLFYTLSHETSHILSSQNNEAVNAIKKSINISNPYIAGEMQRYRWDEDYTRDEFTAAIVGGMNKPEWVVGDQSESIKSARKASTAPMIPITDKTPESYTMYGDIGPTIPPIKPPSTNQPASWDSMKRTIGTAVAQYTNPRTTPSATVASMRRTFQAQGAKEFKWWDSFFSIPFRFAQKYNDPKEGGQWEGLWDVHVNQRAENRSELTSNFLKTADDFLNARKNWRKEGLNGKEIDAGLEKVERVITAGNIIIHERLKTLLQTIQGKKGAEFTALQKQINELRNTGRFSDDELKSGVTDEYGDKIPSLTDREIKAYVAARKGYDLVWEANIAHLTDMTFQKYRKQKWYGILLAASGTPMEKAETMAVLNRKGLNKAALARAQKIQVNIASVFAQIEKGLTTTPPEEIASAGAKYDKIFTKMTTELKTLQGYIGQVSGVKDPKELAQLTREVFSAYLMTRPHLKEISRLRNEAKEWPGYAPQYRDQGKMKGRLVEKFLDEDGNVDVDEQGVPVEDRQVHMEMVNNEKEAERLIERMAKLYPHAFEKGGKLKDGYFIEWEAQSTSPEAAFQGVNDVNVQKIIDDSISNMKVQETYYDKDGNQIDVYDKLRDAAFQSIADQFKKRGAMRYTLHRNQKYGAIKGYKETGLQKVYVNYASSMAGLMTKQQAAADSLEILSKISDPAMFTSMAKWNREQLRNESPADRISGMAKATAFTYMLGGLLKSAAVNATQPIIVGIPELKKYMREHGVKGMGGKVMLQASADVLAGKTSPMEKRLMEEAIRKGVATDQYIQSIFDTMRGRFGEKFYGAMRFLGLPFSKVEVHNRLTTLVAFSRVAYPGALKDAKAQGLTGKEAEDAAYETVFNEARIFNNNVNYAYGKANRPLAIQSGDLLGVVGSALYTFKAFPHNLLARQADLLSKGDFRTFAHTMAYMAVFGGLMGLPFFKDFFEWFEKKFGYSPTNSIRRTLRGIGGETLETLGVSGLPAVLGANISGSINIGLPWPLGSATPADSVFGVMGSLAKRGSNVAQALERGDVKRAVAEFSPEFLRAPMTALKESEIGKELGYQGFATNPRGNVIYGEDGKPLSLSNKEAILKMGGFNPTQYARAKEQNATAQRLEAWVADRKTNIAETLRIARLEKKPDAIKEAMISVRDLNRKIRDRDLQKLVPLASMQRIILASRQIPGAKQRRESAFKRAEL